MKIYELEKGDLFKNYNGDVFRYHGMDGMYARVTAPEFTDLYSAFDKQTVWFFSCGWEVEKLETSERSTDKCESERSERSGGVT